MRRPSPRGGTYVGLDLPGVRGADADPSPFHEGTATPCYYATVSCWWHFPIDLDESCQNRVSPPRAEAFSARRKVRLPGSCRWRRRRRRSFAFSRGRAPGLGRQLRRSPGAFPDRSRRELSEYRSGFARGGLLPTGGNTQSMDLAGLYGAHLRALASRDLLAPGPGPHALSLSPTPRLHTASLARASARERQCGAAGVSRRLLKFFISPIL